MDTFEVCQAEYDDLEHMNFLGGQGWEPVAVQDNKVLMKRRRSALVNAWSGKPRPLPLGGEGNA